MANLGTTIYGAVLQRQAEDRARAVQQEQMQYDRDQTARSQTLQMSQLDEQRKEAEFNRQAKLAELQGKYAGALGQPAPSGYNDAAVGEYAQTGYMGGQDEAQKAAEAAALRRFVQEQITGRTGMVQQNTNMRAQNSNDMHYAIAGTQEGDKFALQQNNQDFQQNVAFPEAFRRAMATASQRGDDDTMKLLVQIAGMQAGAESKVKLGPYDSILNPRAVTDYQNRPTAQPDFWQRMADTVRQSKSGRKSTSISVPMGAIAPSTNSTEQNPVNKNPYFDD